ncbi:hypothetical protein PUMCH_003453 [Australozyma saopauloensis]|uniref:Uncharacterized protein n=1 Tax=Australozyma saopauloensis TaxID=291208 RepID=A0AAX4HC01_9ASCO|nr:hypothetical protein PUMCH_003453 [[Candida] saopauloensis]
MAPIARSVRLRPFTRKRATVAICSPDTSKPVPNLETLVVPSFSQNDTLHVLVKDLASLWNFPSSYQVIGHMSRRLGVSKDELVQKSTRELNKRLYEQGLILESDVDTVLFYMDLLKLTSILVDCSILFGEFQLDEFPSGLAPDTSLDKVAPTVEQVFPDVGEVDKTLPLTYASFLALNPLTKLQVYKHEGTYRKLYSTALTAGERELLLRENEFWSYDFSLEGNSAHVDSKADNKKNSKSRRTANLDPNTLDVTENILPGSGVIPRFVVNSVCKVPNYYATNNLMGITQQNSYYNRADEHLGGLKLKFSDSSNASKQISLLIPAGDQDSFLYKYYYYKHYRGPGAAGVFKDSVMTSKINKIRTLDEDPKITKKRPSHIPAYRVMKQEPMAQRNVKPLVHPYYAKENVEVLVLRQRVYTEDFDNMEMLHNTNTFNILTNAYRGIGDETWKLFFKFKSLDFEKLYLIQKAELRKKKKDELVARQAELQLKSEIQLPTPPELAEILQPDLSNRFTLPTHYPEIMQKIPVHLRGNPDDPLSQISGPLRYVARTADKGTPEYLNQIEVIKLPNANSIAWDNLRKYRRP